MIKEQVIIKSIEINRPGEIIHFQIKLPSNAKRIIGVEIGGQKLNEVSFLDHTPSPIEPLPVAGGDGGSPAIHGEGTEGGGRIFDGELVDSGHGTAAEGAVRPSTGFKPSAVLGELRLQSCEEGNNFYSNLVKGDANLAYMDFTKNIWMPKQYTHQTRSLEEVVMVDAETTTVLGLFGDRPDLKKEGQFKYRLNIYLWYEKY
jgi:hypothetical protein